MKGIKRFKKKLQEDDTVAPNCRTTPQHHSHKRLHTYHRLEMFFVLSEFMLFAVVQLLSGNRSPALKKVFCAVHIKM